MYVYVGGWFDGVRGLVRVGKVNAWLASDANG